MTRMFRLQRNVRVNINANESPLYSYVVSHVEVIIKESCPAHVIRAFVQEATAVRGVSPKA